MIVTKKIEVPKAQTFIKGVNLTFLLRQMALQINYYAPTSIIPLLPRNDTDREAVSQEISKHSCIESIFI